MMHIYLDEAHRDRRFTTKVNGYQYWNKNGKLCTKLYSPYDRDAMLNPDCIYSPEEILRDYTMTYDVLITLER